MKSILDVNGVAEMTYLKVGTIYQLVTYRKIPHYKRGGKLYFVADEIEKWLLADSRKVGEIKEESK